MHRITETKLFKLLHKREKADGFEASEISSVVNNIIADSYPILQQVSRSFPLYTLHDPEHGFRVAENITRLIPKRTLSILNSIELSILLYSAYFHDIGMASSQEEFYKWIESDNYQTFMSSNEQWYNELHRIERIQRHKEYEKEYKESHKEKPTKAKKKTKASQPPIEYRRIQDIAYTEYLRINHAKRGAEYVNEQFGSNGKSNSKIQIGEVNYAEYVALVCKSHWENANALRNEDYRRDLYIRQLNVNLQYCCIILRLADLIDLDPDRTPKVLQDFIFDDIHQANSNSEVKHSVKLSADEWAKHRAVLGYKITPDEIRIEAKCSHPAIQKGLNDWCNYIDTERRSCRLILQENTKDITGTYHLELVNEVRTDFIKSDGTYIYTDFKFQLDYDRIVNLLMGTELWGDEMVVFRELLQNSIDACYHRKALSDKLKIPYTPEIIFSSSYDEKNNQLSISCTDNGIGMTKHIVETYLMHIGRSYYNSHEFRSRDFGLYPISQFGLGIMSCFMVTNKIKIDTQYTGDNLIKDDPLSVEIDSKGKYVVLRSLKKDVDGTTVSLIFKDIYGGRDEKFFDDEMFMKGKHGKNHPHYHHLFYSWEQIIQHYAIHIGIPIKFHYNDEREDRIIKAKDFAVPDPLWFENRCLAANHKEFIFSFDYDETNGLAGIFRFLLPYDTNGNLSFVTLIDSKFKIFIDSDGDLGASSPFYQDNSLKVKLEIEKEKKENKNSDDDTDYDWDVAEIRGVYRDRFKQKPPEGSSYEGLLELIERSFTWTQDGLKVDLIDSHSKQKDESEDEIKNRTNIFQFVPVPGLNAADIDIRRDWRTNLNVQRTDFVRDKSLDSFIERYNDLAAKMWLKIIETEGSFSNKDSKTKFINTLIELSDWKLERHIKRILKL
jgi:hypothetical protein